MDAWKCKRSTASPQAPTDGAQRRRRNNRFVGAAACLLLLAGMGSLPNTAGYSAGEPIELVVTPGDTLDVAFEGVNTDALAISFTQCTGDAYLRMSLKYNDSTVGFSTLTNNECNRFLASENTASEDEVSYDQLCAFRTSAAVRQGYTENSVNINGTAFVQPSLVSVVVENKGDAPASGQLVMFAENYPAPNVDDSIDRVQTDTDLLDNTFSVTVDFQASANDDQSFCSSTSGCALYAYYLDIDEDADDADLTFGTSCQAEKGTLFYDEVVTTESTATLATSAFTVSACLQFPSNTEARYRVYLVVSPDTTSHSRVGFGLQDQLIFASEILEVDGDADRDCPEEVEVGSNTDESSGGVRKVVPARATGGLALSLAAAAATAARGGAGGGAVMMGEF